MPDQDPSHPEHRQRLDRIVKDVTQFYWGKTAFRVFHGNTNSTRSLTFKHENTLDVSDLDHILEIDTQKHTALVEPNVPMDKLVQHTVRHGLVPPVVMEFPGITVGGGIQGGAGESSSWQWGCFNRTCNWYEMVLANGELVTASPKHNQDLFYGTAGSYGSLGVITAAEIQLVPAKKYVILHYLHVTNFHEAIATIKKAIASKKYEYIDGIMFAANRGVIICGQLSDTRAGSVQRFSRAHDPWFYLHAEQLSPSSADHIETVPLNDYLFRYDRGAFWVGRYAFERANIPFTPTTRWLFNPVLKTRKLYEGLQLSGAAQQYIVQDMAVPETQAVPFLEWIDTKLNAYPLWLCPMKPETDSPLLSNNLKTKLAINVGLWANQKFDFYKHFVDINRVIEHKLRELHGKKWFYAHSYYTEKEFWEMYDRKWYQGLRRKYHAQTLPTVYDKIKVKDQPPVHVTRAALKTIFGLAKLQIRP
jgi:delta24-sterol reductase